MKKNTFVVVAIGGALPFSRVYAQPTEDRKERELQA